MIIIFRQQRDSRKKKLLTNILLIMFSQVNHCIILFRAQCWTRQDSCGGGGGVLSVVRFSYDVLGTGNGAVLVTCDFM